MVNIQSSEYSNHGNDFEILLTLERKGFFFKAEITMIFMSLNEGVEDYTVVAFLWFIVEGSYHVKWFPSDLW